jgi:TolB protein
MLPLQGIFSFSALVNGRYQTHVYDLAASTSTARHIHDGIVDADLQPGDHRLAYRWADSGRGGIWRMDLDGSDQVMLTGFVEDRAPRWSANGAEIFFSSTREERHDINRIFWINADGSGSESRFPIVGRDPVECASGQLLFAGWLTYSPSDCGIIFYQWRQLSGSGEIVGTEYRASDSCSDYRPDGFGNQVVFMRQEGGQPSDVWRNQIAVGVERSAVNMTANTPNSHEALPIFSPDGQWIAFASNRGGQWNIYAMKTNGSTEPTIFIQLPSGVSFPDWNLCRLSWTD